MWCRGIFWGRGEEGGSLYQCRAVINREQRPMRLWNCYQNYHCGTVIFSWRWKGGRVCWGVTVNLLMCRGVFSSIHSLQKAGSSFYIKIFSKCAFPVRTVFLLPFTFYFSRYLHTYSHANNTYALPGQYLILLLTGGRHTNSSRGTGTEKVGTTIQKSKGCASE
jgi:hypothetical protein